MRHALAALALTVLAGSASAEDPAARWDGTAGYVPQLTLQADFGSAGVSAVKFQGVDLTSRAPAVNAVGDGKLTTMQWVGIGFTAVVFGVIAFSASDDDEAAPAQGTGAQ